MRIIVMSDSHGNFVRVRRIVEENKEYAQSFIHLGDGIDEFEDVHSLFPDFQFVAVKGNNDWGRDELKVRTMFWGGKQLLLAHGDTYHVKMTMMPFLMAAREAKADIALYGHTHIACCDYEDGIHLLNPGSVMSGSYMALDITPQGIVPVLRKIQ